jgi:ribosomal protein S10
MSGLETGRDLGTPYTSLPVKASPDPIRKKSGDLKGTLRTAKGVQLSESHKFFRSDYRGISEKVRIRIKGYEHSLVDASRLKLSMAVTEPAQKSRTRYRCPPTAKSSPFCRRPPVQGLREQIELRTHKA